jgi:hypothetical protein
MMHCPCGGAPRLQGFREDPGEGSRITFSCPSCEGRVYVYFYPSGRLQAVRLVTRAGAEFAPLWEKRDGTWTLQWVRVHSL